MKCNKILSEVLFLFFLSEVLIGSDGIIGDFNFLFMFFCLFPNF